MFVIDKIVNFFIILSLIPIFLYGIYGIWDSRSIYNNANSKIYATYRPTEDKETFEQLKKVNEDVFGWLSIKNTNIDYPLVQTDNNSKYVNTNVKGNFSLSGSLFLDYRNKKDFSDLNNIIYGHHMEKKAMFGELEEFANRQYFDAHRTGEIYYSNEWHTVTFFAFLEVDAYDQYLYNVYLQERDQKEYISYIEKHAIQYYKTSFKENEHFLVLSTCTSTSTNGRHLLVGRIIT